MTGTVVKSTLGKAARIGGAGIVRIVMAVAFAGMGLPMWNMGNDINKFSNPLRMMPFVR